jgi:hypothetical protein
MTDEQTDAPTFRGNRAVAWQSDGPVTRAQADARDKSTVTQPDAAQLGPRTIFGSDTSAGAAVGFDYAGETVPAIVAHVREPADQDESRDRARAAWRAEVVREAGIRSGVEDEVGRWLDEAEVGQILADADTDDDRD